jgi:hypothetical protein
MVTLPDPEHSTPETDVARRTEEAHDEEMLFLRRWRERALEGMRRITRSKRELTSAEYDLDGRRR